MRAGSWFRPISVALALGLFMAAPAGAEGWGADGRTERLSPPAPSGFDFRALERAVHAEMNAMRQNPRAYADKLEARRSSYRGNTRIAPDGMHILTHEGVAALDEAIGALRQADRVPRLAWSDLLQAAALGHARDLDASNLVGHSGSDGSQPQDRVALFAKADGWVAENIAFGPRTGEDVVIGLIVDDGVADRGHRKVLLKPDLFVSGTGCGPHPAYGVVCVINYATRVSGGEGAVAAAPAPPAPAVDVWDDAPATPLGDASGEPWDVGDTPDEPWDLIDAAEPADESATCPFLDMPSADVAPHDGQRPEVPSWGPPRDADDAWEAAEPDAAPAPAGRGQELAEEIADPWTRRPMPPPRAPAAALYDDRYPADHPRNQPPGMREVRRPIMRTEGPRRGGGHGWQAPRDRRWDHRY